MLKGRGADLRVYKGVCSQFSADWALTGHGYQVKLPCSYARLKKLFCSLGCSVPNQHAHSPTLAKIGVYSRNSPPSSHFTRRCTFMWHWFRLELIRVSNGPVCARLSFVTLAPGTSGMCVKNIGGSTGRTFHGSHVLQPRPYSMEGRKLCVNWLEVRVRLYMVICFSCTRLDLFCMSLEIRVESRSVFTSWKCSSINGHCDDF